MEEKKKRRITTVEDLSNDLMVEILLSLPLNSIMQCFNVCKRWRSLITGCPLFLTDGVNVACICHQGVPKYTCLEKGNRGRMQISELDFFFDLPTHRRYPYLNYLSCNGLLFSYYFTRESLLPHLDMCYISNPLTRECARLPNPTLACHDSLCGLAFENNPRIIHSSCNNIAFFKIVIVHSINNDIKKASYQFEIYSSDRRAWQLLKWASKPHDLRGCKPVQNAVYCNRVLYWHCHGKRQALMFNLETETSGYLDLPRRDESEISCQLTECAGQLHYIGRCPLGHRLSVFKMSMDGEWLILHDVDISGAKQRNLDFFPMHIKAYHPQFRPLDMSCQGDDIVLLYDNCQHQIISYDLKRDVFEIVLRENEIIPQSNMIFQFLPRSKVFRYTPTNKRINTEELQHEFRTEKSEVQLQF